MATVLQQPQLIEFSRLGDTTIGYLTVAENSNLPFVVQRVYWTYSVSDQVIRGHHAHKELEQIIFAVSGEIKFTLESVTGEISTYELKDPSIGLYIPRLYWRTIKFSRAAVLLCLASLEYKEEEYIRDYDYFKKCQTMIF